MSPIYVLMSNLKIIKIMGKSRYHVNNIKVRKSSPFTKSSKDYKILDHFLLFEEVSWILILI